MVLYYDIFSIISIYLPLIDFVRFSTINKNMQNLPLYDYIHTKYNEKIILKYAKYLKKIKIINYNSKDDIDIDDNIISKLINLNCLMVENNNKITNEGLKYLTNLENIMLCNNNNISDDALKNLSKLKGLYLNGNNITDIGLQYIKGIEFLFLADNTKITDTGIGYLNNIKILDLNSNTNITIEGVKKIKNCKLECKNLNYFYKVVE